MDTIKTKANAIETGATHYRGKGCPHCNSDIYVTATNKCVSCQANIALNLKMKLEGVKKKRRDRAATAESKRELEVRHKLEDKLDQIRADKELEL